MEKKSGTRFWTDYSAVAVDYRQRKKNDFAWWKDAWDNKVLEEHGAEWARVFAEWVQKVLADFENGVGNAFSLFVHAETRRCFHDVVALQVP